MKFVINEFLFSVFVTRKFGRSTFERSSIFKFTSKMSAILNFERLKF